MSDVRKTYRVQCAPVLGKLPQCGQPRLREEGAGQATMVIWADLDQPALEQASYGRRYLRLACVRPGTPGAQRNAVCNGRVGGEMYTQLAANQVALGRCERRWGLLSSAAHCLALPQPDN